MPHQPNHAPQFSVAVQSLLKTSQKIKPQERTWLQMYGGDPEVSEFAPPEAVSQEFISEFSIDDFRAAAQWMGDFFPPPFEKDTPQKQLLTFPQNVRMELLRKKILSELHASQSEYAKTVGEFKSIGLETLDKAIKALTNVPLSRSEQAFREKYPQSIGLDLPPSSSPENTRLHRALTALKNLLELEAQHEHEPDPDIEGVRRYTRDFVLGILNALATAQFRNITDVFGSEPDVPSSENDATRLRVYDHREQIKDRYGVELDIFDQGTTIKCPEQCGFYALIAVNQARRNDPGKKIKPRFFALNNASRTKDNDHLEGAAAALSASDPLVYFRFDLGDGVKHSGTAYGYPTLTYLKPYITDLWTIEGAEKGTQFRSLEFQQHITTEVAMTGGAFPACYKGKKLDKEKIIPSLKLAKNEYQYMGMDKYANGVTSATADEVIAAILGEDEHPARVRVTILSRHTRKPIEGIQPKEYTLARSLGLVRDGKEAIWESSTPTTADPKKGHLSIGMFMKSPGDINHDIAKTTPGSIIRIERIEK